MIHGRVGTLAEGMQLKSATYGYSQKCGIGSAKGGSRGNGQDRQLRVGKCNAANGDRDIVKDACGGHGRILEGS